MGNEYSDLWYDIFLERGDPISTKSEISFITKYLPLTQYNSVLDCACATGRHSKALAALGYQVMGIDINAEAIREAKLNSSDDVIFKVHDMQNIRELEDQFDAVIIMWQSFGYYDPVTNRDIILQIYDKLNPKGRLILDIYNRKFFSKNQGVRTFQRNKQRMTETKFMKNNRLTVKIEYGVGFESDTFEWQLYSPEEINSLCNEIGFKTLIQCANFSPDLSPSDEIPRMQFVFEKS